MMERTGQYAIIEHTILIGVGIAIALGFLAVFQGMSEDIEGSATNIEARMLSQFMAANAVELIESGSEGKYTVDLPEDITSNEYAIRMTDTGVDVVTTGATETAALYGLERKTGLDGSVVSSEGTVSLVFAGDELTLGAEQ